MLPTRLRLHRAGRVFIALVATLAAAGPAQTQAPPPPGATPEPAVADAELRQLEDMMASFRKRNASRFGIAAPNGIDEGRYVKAGGIEQWLRIRGESRDNPVILLVHGGPGDVTSPWTYALFNEWEKSYTVVQWDQRGAGRTLRKTGPDIAATLTIDRMVKDGIEITETVLRDLRKDKLIIVGHSWGSTLGALMAKARPELYYAFVGTGQVADTPKAALAGYEAVLARARALKHEEAVAELTGIGPPPYADAKGRQGLRKWSGYFEGSNRFIGGTLGFALASPGYTPADVLDWINGQDVSGRALYGQINSIDPRSFSGEFKVPVFVIQGELDYTTPTALARDYAAAVKAPKKAFVILPDVGHFALFMKPEEFLRELNKHVRPLLR